jgi:hypothetical protein
MKDNQHEQLFTELTAESEAPAFTELDDEVAATCSGGIRFGGPDPDMILFEHANFQGRSLRVNATIGDGDDNLDNALIGNGWNDRTSSIIIYRGRWQLFRNAGYTGPVSERIGGRYANWTAFGHRVDNDLTGIRRIG